MKKMITLALFACLLFGCSLEDDQLVGTCWYTQDINYETEHGGVCNEIYEFTSPTELECYTTQNGIIVEEYGTYTYKLTYPNLKIITNKGKVRHYTFVDSRTMILDGSAEDEFYATYFLER